MSALKIKKRRHPSSAYNLRPTFPDLLNGTRLRFWLKTNPACWRVSWPVFKGAVITRQPHPWQEVIIQVT